MPHAPRALCDSHMVIWEDDTCVIHIGSWSSVKMTLCLIHIVSWSSEIIPCVINIVSRLSRKMMLLCVIHIGSWSSGKLIHYVIHIMPHAEAMLKCYGHTGR